MVTFVRVAASTAYPRVVHPLTFVTVAAAPDPAIVVPIEPIRLSRPVEEPRVPAVVETIAQKRIEQPVERPREPETVVARATPVVPPPAPKAVATPVGHAIEPPKPVQVAGFDAPAARAALPDIKPARAAVGAFESSAATSRPQAGSDRPNIVAESGFGTAMASAPRTPSKAVGDAGFGAAEAAKPAVQAGSVKSVDFDARPAAPALPAAKPQRIDVPVEVLSKPTPAYTDEARAAKIEGDVILEVDFTATGEIRVVRVVRGLGHGLDESATRAALGIKFKPAQSGGHPIDFRTTIHIVFRLA